MSQSTRAWPVVSTHWLREQLMLQMTSRFVRRVDIRVLDVTFNPDVTSAENQDIYEQGHIPEAVFYDMWRCVERTPEIPRNIPETDSFTDYIRSMGIRNDTHVVAYDRFGVKAAYRTWWLFKLFGHKSVSVLDGGLRKWSNDRYGVTQNTPEVKTTDFETKFNRSLLLDYKAMVDNLMSGKYQVVDARSYEETATEYTEPGYLPGSRVVEFNAMFKEDGTIKSAPELIKLFTEAGVDLEWPIVTTCLQATKACGLAAAIELLGKPDTPVYYGAWTEWRQRSNNNMKCLLKRKPQKQQAG